MTLGQTPRQTDLLRSTVQFCQDGVPPDSTYGVLHRECYTAAKWINQAGGDWTRYAAELAHNHPHQH